MFEQVSVLKQSLLRKTQKCAVETEFSMVYMALPGQKEVKLTVGS